MRNWIALCCALCFGGLSLIGQADTTIYKVVEDMPRFPACESLDTTLAAKKQCAQQALLNYVYSRVLYPLEAQQAGLEGTTVVTFVVEKDGTITQPAIVRDLGGGTGQAALNVINTMQTDGIRWVPGYQNGQAVRVQFNLPVRFKLEEPDPFVMIGRDSVYTILDEPLQFLGGMTALESFLDQALVYPAGGNDSCYLGQIDVQVLIRASGDVEVLDMTDYNDLGFDFWYAAIDAATSTYGQWRPAQYEGRPVNAAFDLSMSFLPEAASCTNEVQRYATARETANAGSDLVEEGQTVAGIAKMTEAVDAFPGDAQFRIMRGQAYFDNEQLGEACEDLRTARRIALIDWFDTILPLICR